MLRFKSAIATEPSAAKGVVKAGKIPDRSITNLLGSRSLAFVQVLQRGNLDALLVEGANSPRCRVGRGQRGNTRYIVANCSAPNRLLVVKRFAAQWRVDDQIDFSGFHQVYNVGPALVHFEDRFRLDSCGFQSCGGAARGQQPKAKCRKLLA